MTDSCLAGYHGTIFAYGQVTVVDGCILTKKTGSGKTYTVQGNLVNGRAIYEQRGIMPRIFEYLFGRIAKDERSVGSLVCSF